MNSRLFIESVEPGAVTLTDSAKFMEGNRAMLGAADVGALLRVLSEHRSEMKSADGDFEIARAHGDQPYAFMGRICGAEFGMPVSYAHLLKCALEGVALAVARTRT